MASERRRLRPQPRGQTLITVALGLVVLLAFVGLAVDVGLMMLARNELQNAADAAALAGAQKFYETSHHAQLVGRRSTGPRRRSATTRR